MCVASIVVVDGLADVGGVLVEILEVLEDAVVLVVPVGHAVPEHAPEQREELADVEGAPVHEQLGGDSEPLLKCKVTIIPTTGKMNLARLASSLKVFRSYTFYLRATSSNRYSTRWMRS